LGLQIYYKLSYPQVLCNYFAEKMREPAHIALFASWYPTDPEALNGNFCRAFALLLSEKYRVSVIHVEMDENIRRVQIEEKTDGKMQVFTARVPRRKGIFFAPQNQWRWFRTYALLLHRAEQVAGKAGLIHAEVVWKAGLAAWKLAWQRKIPFVLREHWTGYYPADPQLKGWKAILHRMILRRAAGVAAVSLPLARALERWGAKPGVAIIANTVHLPENLEVQQQPEPPVFVHVTNFREAQKQNGQVIDTFLQWKQQRPDAQLWVVGRGYASLPESLRRDRSVHFTGALARHELTALYHRATALISYSRFETFAMSVAEALVCGCPVIYTACGGPESFVLPGMGLQVDAEKPATLLAAMEEIAARDRFDREAIARQAQLLFDPQTLLDTYTRWIKEL
jgi:glycosyltransferase involved in cell wall biosynthesis